MELTQSGKQLSQFIFFKPQIVVRILEDNGYRLSNKVTLDEIVAKTYTALYDGNAKFESDLDQAIVNEGYANFASLAVSAGLGIISAIGGARQARKQRELQANIALAQLEQQKLLTEEELRVYGELERTRILANTLQQYRSNLQSEATKRQKNVAIYIASLAMGIGVIYGTIILINDI